MDKKSTMYETEKKVYLQNIEICLSQKVKTAKCKETLSDAHSEVESYIKELSATNSTDFAWSKYRDDIIELRQELNHNVQVDGGSCSRACIQYDQVYRASPRTIVNVANVNFKCQTALENRVFELEKIGQLKITLQSIDDYNLEVRREENANIDIGLDLIKETSEELKVDGENNSNFHEDL